jgi:hypothetical protein
MRDRVSLETVSVSLPFGIGSMSWKVDTTQKKAAWSLYVELVTRIAVQPLEVDQGLVREAMNSLYSLFGTTREVLKAAGPDVGASRDSVGGIAIAVLNSRSPAYQRSRGSISSGIIQTCYIIRLYINPELPKS